MENIEAKAKDKRDLQAEVYKSHVRFHTTAMITDKNSGEEKSEGMLFAAPLFKVGARISLKNVTLVTSLVNTCKSQTAITAETRNYVYTEIYNRKYTLELQDAFDNLLNKLENLKKQVESQSESAENTKYKPEDIEKVRQFLNDIKNEIGDNEDTIAENIYESNMSGTDLLATLDRISSNKFPTWALAFAGYDDNDTSDLVGDDRKRNPVDVFFGDSVSTKNGSHLKTLIGTQSLDMLNDNFMNKLKNKDFSAEIRRTSIEHNPGYNYYLCYFVQALLQLVLIDNEKSLTPMNRATIKSNWDNFLRDLSDPDLENMFDGYEPNEIENRECPYKFVNFMLNKLLGKDLLQKLDIDEGRCKCYAKGSSTISESLANAKHANQIITMGLDYTLDNPTYNNSLFIGQGEFVYAALYNAYKKMDDALKQKLQFLAFELNTKKIKLDQSGYKVSDEYKFGRMQEVKQNRAKDSQTGELKETGDIKDIKYKVPDDYDTDISVEDLMDLVLKFQTIEKDFTDKLNQLISEANEDNIKNFLDLLIKFQKIDVYLNNNQVESILEDEDIIKAMFGFINKQECDQKYIDVYSWLINNHPEFIDSIDINFIKVDLLTADGLYSLFTRKTNKDNFKNEDKAKLLLESWKNNKFRTELTEFINADVITEMFAKDSNCTNQIIIKFLDRFDKAIIQKIDLADKSLSGDQINEIVYNQHNNLKKDQIKSIDFSKLNNLSTKILFKNRLADISQGNVNTFSNIALKELTLFKLATLLGKNRDLDFSKHKNWLQSLYLNELYLKFKNDPKPFVHFIAKHMDIFSDDQILSLKNYVFEKFKDEKSALGNDATKILNKLAEIEKTGKLEKNIVKITGIMDNKGPSYSIQAMAILVHIYQKSPNDLTELLSYLIKNNEPFAEYANKVFYCMLHETRDEVIIERCFPCYQQMYGKISADAKDKSQQLDKDGYKYCLSKIREIFKTVLKEDKDPNDTGKGKNINYLCLSKLPLIVSWMNKLQDLSNLLSDEQIKSIDMRNINLALGDVYSLLDKFGNKMKYEQLYQLVSSFNNNNIKLLTWYDKPTPGTADNASSGLLAKIALISNFINGKEKAFQDKYSDVDKKFEEAIDHLDGLVNKISVQEYPNNNAKQSVYYRNNMHNRERYEKNDNTEDVHNDLKVGKDDKEILDKLGKLNDALTCEMKELDEKVNKTEELDKIVAKIKEEIEKSKNNESKNNESKNNVVTTDQLNQIVKKVEEWAGMVANTKELREIATKVKEEITKAGKNVITIEDILANIKDLDKDAVTINQLDEIVAKTKESYEYKSIVRDCGNKLPGIKQKMEEFDQLYYGRKKKFSKLKKNFFIALGHLDTGKISILLRNMYSNYEQSFLDKKELDNETLQTSLKVISNNNKIFWELDPIVIKVGDTENKYTFNEFFMDGFIKIQAEQKRDGTKSNFSLQQKQSMGIINMVDKTEEKDEKDPNKIKVTKFEQCTPEYMLENLPIVLEQFHCNDDQLKNEMEKVNLLNLTLKFEQENKKSLERFIDSEKLKFIENASGDNAAQRERNAEMNNENHRYFKAVQKLFCVNADNIVKNADLVFETENPNGNGQNPNGNGQNPNGNALNPNGNGQNPNGNALNPNGNALNPNGNGQKMNGNAFRIKYAPLIQFEFHRELTILTRKEVEGKIDYLDKQNIIEKLAAMKENDKRIYEHFLFFCGDWICHSSKFLSEDVPLENFKNIVKKRIEFGCLGQGQNKLELNEEIYNLLTAVTLISGLESADGLSKVDTVIDEICFLITGKRGNFVPDDLRLIRSVTKLLDDCNIPLNNLILEHVIKNQDYKHVFTCLNMFDKEKLLDSSDKVKWIEYISDKDKKIDLMSVISNIYKFNFDPDYGGDYNYAMHGGHRKRKLNFEFMQKLMNQLLQKYDFEVYPNERQKEILGNFLKKFIVDNAKFEDNKQKVSDFFEKLMAKVPLRKSKEVTKEIIKICSNVRENNQRAAILKYVLDASNNSLKGLELLEVLKQHNYAREFVLYDKGAYQKSIEAIKLDGDLIEKLISDIIKKTLPLTKKEVQQLKWFCANSKPDKSIFSDNQVSMFLKLIQKMPEGSMSLDMCLNLITKFFPTLSKEIEYENYYGKNQTYTVLNLSNLGPHKDDIIKNLAYALPQNQLADIVRLFKLVGNTTLATLLGFDWNNYDYEEKDENGKNCRYKWVDDVNVNYEYTHEYTHKYQEKVKEEQEDRKKQEEAAEQEEAAKTERTQKMITVFNKSYKNKINKTILTEFKQMYESAKELKQKNNNNDIRDSIESQTQNDNNSQSIDLNNDQKNINTEEIKTDKEEEKIEEVIQQDDNDNIINLEENQNQNLNSNKKNINTEEIKINEKEEGDQNDINNKLNTEEIKIDKEEKIEKVIQQDNNNNNIINLEENQNEEEVINPSEKLNNNEIKENKEEKEEIKINNASIKTDEIQKGFNNNNNEDQSHKNIQEEKEKEVEINGDKIINNNINKKEEPKIKGKPVEIKDEKKEIINNCKDNIIKGKIRIEENREEKKEENREEKKDENIIGVIVNKNIIDTSKEENLNGQIKNENKFNTNDQIDKNQKNSTVIINNNNTITNKLEENQPHESDNPYTLSAWLGFLPIVPAIIFGVKTQHKLTGGDIALIIVGLFPIISAIVFGIMAYKYNQNILDKKTQENLKYTVNLNENDIEKKRNENNKDEQTNVFGIINGNKNPSQDQKNKE